MRITARSKYVTQVRSSAFVDRQDAIVGATEFFKGALARARLRRKNLSVAGELVVSPPVPKAAWHILFWPEHNGVPFVAEAT